VVGAGRGVGQPLIIETLPRIGYQPLLCSPNRPQNLGTSPRNICVQGVKRVYFCTKGNGGRKRACAALKEKSKVLSRHLRYV
jgi:hypothetical protein